MRVLVTGASGFVGSRLLPRLERGGAETIGIDHEVDVRDAAALAAAVSRARPDAVVHLAALSFVPDSIADPGAAFRVNLLGSRALLEAVRSEAPAARVLWVGSGAVYGSAEPGAPPFAESAPLRPGSPYAWTKAAADRLARCYAAGGLAVVRARPFNHTGPGRPDHFVESSFARQIAERELGLASGPLVVGNLDAVRDFLDVEDVLDAYQRLLDPGIPPAAYNVASGTPHRIGDVLEELLAVARVKPAVEVDRGRWRAADALVGDAGRLRAASGWQPRTSLRDTLARLLESWREALSA